MNTDEQKTMCPCFCVQMQLLNPVSSSSGRDNISYFAYSKDMIFSKHINTPQLKPRVKSSSLLITALKVHVYLRFSAAWRLSLLAQIEQLALIACQHKQKQRAGSGWSSDTGLKKITDRSTPFILLKKVLKYFLSQLCNFMFAEECWFLSNTTPLGSEENQ